MYANDVKSTDVFKMASIVVNNAKHCAFLLWFSALCQISDGGGRGEHQLTMHRTETLPVGSNVTFSCDRAYTNQIAWSFYATSRITPLRIHTGKVHLEPRYHVLVVGTTNQLVITNVQQRDAGRYECIYNDGNNVLNFELVVSDVVVTTAYKELIFASAHKTTKHQNDVATKLSVLDSASEKTETANTQNSIVPMIGFIVGFLGVCLVIVAVVVFAVMRKKHRAAGRIAPSPAVHQAAPVIHLTVNSGNSRVRRGSRSATNSPTAMNPRGSYENISIDLSDVSQKSRDVGERQYESVNDLTLDVEQAAARCPPDIYAGLETNHYLDVIP